MAQTTREFLAERDQRIFAMRKSGLPLNEIAKRFDISTGAVRQAIKRQLEQLNREAFMDHPEVLRMELERLDALQAAVWPLTQHRMVELPDGTKTMVEPDIRFVQQALAIVRDRVKLLGLEQTTLNVNVEGDQIKSTLAGVEKPVEIDAHDPKQEAIQLIELMQRSGILPENIFPQKELEAAPLPSLKEIMEATGGDFEEE